MAIKFSPGPCGCCNENILFWINESYYNLTNTSTPGIVASQLYLSLGLTVHSYIQELDESIPTLVGTDKYSGDISEYKLIFWCLPTIIGTSLPDWWKDVINSSAFSGRLVILTDPGVYFLSDVFNLNNILASAGIGLSLNTDYFTFTGIYPNKLLGNPFFVNKIDKLMANINVLTPFLVPAALILGAGIELSFGQEYINGQPQGVQYPWLSRLTHQTNIVDFVLSGSRHFIDELGSNFPPTDKAQFLKNLYYIPIQ